MDPFAASLEQWHVSEDQRSVILSVLRFMILGYTKPSFRVSCIDQNLADQLSYVLSWHFTLLVLCHTKLSFKYEEDYWPLFY